MCEESQILITDLHEQPFKEEKFKTQRKNIIERFIQFFANKNRKKEKAIALIKAEIEERKIGTAITNGDFSESKATERGMETQEDRITAQEVESEYRQKLGLKKIIRNGGNHEFGYNLPLGTDPKRGIRWQSIQNFMQIAGWEDIYHSVSVCGYKLIFIPYIFSEEEAYDFDIRLVQIRFLKKMKADLESDMPIILFVHDPDSFDHRGLLKLIRDYKSRIKVIFFGHYHSWINLLVTKILVDVYVKWWLILPRILINIIILLLTGEIKKVEKISAYFRKRKNIPKLIKDLGATLIPAPTGMFGIGGGFLILNINDDGTYSIEKHKI